MSERLGRMILPFVLGVAVGAACGGFVDPEGTKVELWELPETAGSEGRTLSP
ncbi:MAG TPA: hypothetical protein VMT85_25035 [Thermoanaerobaculia bacterium]|nr:hypothetical protein [Thermoanaerobaculia bacterium]